MSSPNVAEFEAEVDALTHAVKRTITIDDKRASRIDELEALLRLCAGMLSSVADFDAWPECRLVVLTSEAGKRETYSAPQVLGKVEKALEGGK